MNVSTAATATVAATAITPTRHQPGLNVDGGAGGAAPGGNAAMVPASRPRRAAAPSGDGSAAGADVGRTTSAEVVGPGRGRLDRADLRDHAVAALWNRLDIGRLGADVAERLPELRDRARQRFVGDRAPRAPNLAQQLVARHDAPRALHERDEQSP